MGYQAREGLFPAAHPLFLAVMWPTQNQNGISKQRRQWLQTGEWRFFS
jgi:hypothetical protein